MKNQTMLKNMTTKILASTLFILLVACSQTPETTINIGFIGPLTGTASTYGIPELNAAQIAIDELNSQGGINGKHVTLIVEDGKCDGAASTTAAKKLIEIDHVSAILGGHCSTESMAVLPITEQNNVFLMAGATGTDKFSGAGQYAFRTFPPANILYGKLAEFAQEQGTKSIATLSDQGPWPQSVVGNFASRFSQLGGKVLAQETYAPGTTDFRTQLLKIKNKNPDAIMISVQGPDAAAGIIKQMQELNMSQQIYGDALVVSKPTYQKTNGLLPPTAIGGTIHVDPETNDLTKNVLEKYTTRFGELGLDAFYITESYDGTKIVAALITDCGNDAACMRTHILAKEWQGASGGFTFNEQGNPTPHIAIKRVENNTDVFLWKG